MVSTANCVFCAIIKKELPSNIIKETDDIIVIKDRSPKAPIHYLIVSKKHLDDIRQLQDNDVHIAGNMLLMAKEISKTLPEPQAFRLISNNGIEVGQSVFHMHFHFLAGKTYTDF